MSVAVQAGIFAAGLAVGAIAAVTTSYNGAPVRPAAASQPQQSADFVAKSSSLGTAASTSTTVFGNTELAASANLLAYGFPGKDEFCAQRRVVAGEFLHNIRKARQACRRKPFIKAVRKAHFMFV